MAKIQIILGFLIGVLVFTLFHYNAPVLLFMEAKKWTVTDNQVSAEVEGYKIRNCQIINGSTIGYVMKNGTVTEVPVTFTDKGKTRPSSVSYKINFGEWIWHFNHQEAGASSVLVVGKYECGGTIVTQSAGPFKLPLDLLRK